jgi:hypothetical protein
VVAAKATLKNDLCQGENLMMRSRAQYAHLKSNDAQFSINVSQICNDRQKDRQKNARFVLAHIVTGSATNRN